MWPFSSQKHKTLSHAVLSGDLRAVRKMLDQGADPNKCDPDDDSTPINYALNHGPEMVQLLVDHGANVNIPARGSMPLAFAESHGYTEVVSILRKAGARLRSDDEEFSMDPRFRLQIKPRISVLVLQTRIQFPSENPEQIADRVAPLLKYQLPPNMPLQEQEKVRKEIRVLILDECGVKREPRPKTKSVPSPEEVMKQTDMSEDELTRRFMEHLIQQGKNPFEEMPEHVLRNAEHKFPDLVELARRKFGTNR
jgi:hypothetical protein